MANDFDGQIDYLEQFGSCSVSPSFLHVNLLFLFFRQCGVYMFFECFHSFCLQFKESALRKQSLYLKFDPLLRESPKKCAGPTHVTRPAAFVSQYGLLLFSLTMIGAVT